MKCKEERKAKWKQFKMKNITFYFDFNFYNIFYVFLSELQ